MERRKEFVVVERSKYFSDLFPFEHSSQEFDMVKTVTEYAEDEFCQT